VGVVLKMERCQDWSSSAIAGVGVVLEVENGLDGSGSG
jgi:hypothetical protein